MQPTLKITTIITSLLIPIASFAAPQAIANTTAAQQLADSLLCKNIQDADQQQQILQPLIQTETPISRPNSTTNNTIIQLNQPLTYKKGLQTNIITAFYDKQTNKPISVFAIFKEPIETIAKNTAFNPDTINKDQKSMIKIRDNKIAVLTTINAKGYPTVMGCVWDKNTLEALNPQAAK